MDSYHYDRGTAMKIIGTEPALSANVIAGAIGAILVALVALKVIVLTPEQQAALMAAVVAVLPIVAALWSRTQTTPLIDPVDEDGEPLTRTDNTPSIAAQKQMGIYETPPV